MWTTLLTVGLVHWLIMVTPGPNVLLVSHLAASGQGRAAFWAALGISGVAVFWALLAMLGIKALFAAQPGIRLGVQIAGGLYLGYLAWRIWLNSGLSSTPAPTTPAPAAALPTPLTAAEGLRLGLVTNLLNPKSALMFSSLFAAALPTHLPSFLQVAVLAMVWFNAVLWHVFLAGAFSRPGVQAVYARQRRWLGRLSSLCVGAFGARLLWVSARD